MTERRGLSEQIVERRPLDASQGNSGNTLELVMLADGRALVLKSVSPEWDWISRVTNDDGRIATLWEQGVFDRMPSEIEHGTVGVERDGNVWRVFMRDLSDALFRDDIRHDGRTARRILGAAASIHEAFWNVDVPGLCTIEERYGMLSMHSAEQEKARGNEGVAGLIDRAWDAYHDHAQRDVADVIIALSENPKPIADELRTCDQTLIHGDLRIGNAGGVDDRTVLVDWGDRAGIAPPAVDLAWFIGFDGKRLDVTRDEIVSMFQELEGERFDEHALSLALIGGLVHLAAHIGLGFVTAETDDQAAAAAEELGWWTERVRSALEDWSPPSRM